MSEEGHGEPFKVTRVGLSMLLPVFASIGCLTLTGSEQMQSWVGSHSSTLAAQWGLPQQKLSDGRGGEIWIYETVRDYMTPAQVVTNRDVPRVVADTVFGLTPEQGAQLNRDLQAEAASRATTTTTYIPARSYRRVTRSSFYVDKDGIVYDWARR